MNALSTMQGESPNCVVELESAFSPNSLSRFRFGSRFGCVIVKHRQPRSVALSLCAHQLFDERFEFTN
nr:COBW domain-containing protein 1 isoform X1 [Ipomoea batatas]GMD48148.1 COBW domain-containing protein 1 isoform X1 [Ipomoea batatas]